MFSQLTACSQRAMSEQAQEQALIIRRSVMVSRSGLLPGAGPSRRDGPDWSLLRKLTLPVVVAAKPQQLAH